MSEPSDCPATGDGSAQRHRQVLAVACAVGVLAFALERLPGGRVTQCEGFHSSRYRRPCGSQAWLGIRCPGCGLTRSIIHLAEGDWRASWHNHRLGGLMAAVIALQIPYRLLALCRAARPLIAPLWHAGLIYGLIALLLANWLVDLVAGRPSPP